ncbi:uncharacterized protein LOC125494839 [Beta vulgaris subsp. vulgaris]|uniref:uncharacterized protein LOC125494839 n=1 Tax=Beta vulgaris subsp. vulgaris TaxID=3555 RepID=UPI002548C295|nr:uncharacterized protein LOC125494839 [Beta vulgaris subsp. vulgaris]
MVAPGSLSDYIKMKTHLKGKEVREKQNEVFLRKANTQSNVLKDLKYQMVGSQLERFSKANHFQHVLEEENENSMNSDDLESRHISDDDDAEGGNDDVQGGIDESSSNALSKVKRTIGLTMCKDVHEWTIDDRTLARNCSLAPLNKLNWHKVLDKDKIWEFVKIKFIISEEGKDYVLAAVEKLWRRHKSIIVKKKHFSAYDNDDDRLENAPDNIPEAYFKELLDYWKLDIVEEESKKKSESSINQKDRHTMGPVSFARKEHELQQQDNEKKRPSQALLYKESRKRKANKIYKTAYEPIKFNILFILLPLFQM